MNSNMDALKRSNDTAFYVFDIAALKKRIAYLRSRLPAEIQLCYAIKANSFIVKELINDVERFEICSPGEAEICAALGAPSEKAVISGVYKTPASIEKLAADVNFKGIFTAESLRQYELICALSEKYGRTFKVLLRLTNASQFGMNEEDIEGIIRESALHKNISIIGIQFFSGTQKTSLKKFKREIEQLDALLLHLKESLGFAAEELEYGTGFPATYFDSDEIDEEELLAGFSELVRGMNFKGRIVLELGRSIAASCGKYFTHIVDIKRNKGQNYLLVDGGMHQLVYYGQHMAMKRPFLSVVGKESAQPAEEWTVCGALCSMNDIICKQIPFPEVEVGDLICFENTGAYCVTEGIALFLSRELPAVYLINEKGEIITARKPFETLEHNTPKYERKI